MPMPNSISLRAEGKGQGVRPPAPGRGERLADPAGARDGEGGGGGHFRERAALLAPGARGLVAKQMPATPRRLGKALRPGAGGIVKPQDGGRLDPVECERLAGHVKFVPVAAIIAVEPPAPGATIRRRDRGEAALNIRSLKTLPTAQASSSPCPDIAGKERQMPGAARPEARADLALAVGRNA